MDDAALVFGFREHFSRSLKHTQAFISNDEFYAIEPTAAQPFKELCPAGLVLFHAFCCTENLAVSIFIDCNGDKNGYVFVFAAPIPLQINAVYIHIWVLSSLKRTISPLFNMNIRFLIQLADRG